MHSEVEPAREIKKYLEGKEIVFVYVSLDEKQEKSLEATLKFNIEGVHLWGGRIKQEYYCSKIQTYRSTYLCGYRKRWKYS